MTYGASVFFYRIIFVGCDLVKIINKEIDLRGLRLLIEMKKTCIKCGVIFECTELSSCWCMDIPYFSKLNNDDHDCLCKICLLKI